jgi:type IV secretory pathway TrbL component
MMSDIITQAANSYITTFQGYESIFKGWGETLFFSLLGINLVWIGLWCAIDRSSLPDAFSEFLKKFFIRFFCILNGRKV